MTTPRKPIRPFSTPRTNISYRVLPKTGHHAKKHDTLEPSSCSCLPLLCPQEPLCPSQENNADPIRDPVSSIDRFDLNRSITPSAEGSHENGLGSNGGQSHRQNRGSPARAEVLYGLPYAAPDPLASTIVSITYWTTILYFKKLFSH